MTSNKPARDALTRDGEYIVRAQKRLRRAYSRLGTWRRVAGEIGLNVRYVYDLAVRGRVPRSGDKRAALGLPRKMPSERIVRMKAVLPRIGDPGWEMVYFKKIK